MQFKQLQISSVQICSNQLLMTALFFCIFILGQENGRPLEYKKAGMQVKKYKLLLPSYTFPKFFNFVIENLN